ncbi:MAG: TIGR00730 family Rossman fold protein [Planctomycetaceae bacterium]|nr:TIGR00730 family Rossman fold protein [Planctomycetaceae bacterium]
MIQALCVFCGSKTGILSVHEEAARELGRELAKHEIRLVYGGGNIGLMGVIADEVLAHSGKVTGVIPEALTNRELAHTGVDDMRIVDSMHTRKATMAQLADAFVALPGGIGTFEELFEILTWKQLGIHHKPVALLNVSGYYDPLLSLMDRAVAEGFLSSHNRELLWVETTVRSLMARLLAWKSPEQGAEDGDDEALEELT